MSDSHRTRGHFLRNFIGLVLFMLAMGLVVIYADRPQLQNYANQCPSQSGFRNAAFCGYVRLGFGEVPIDLRFWIVLIIGGIVTYIVAKLVNVMYGSNTSSK